MHRDQYRQQEVVCLRLASEASENYVKVALTEIAATSSKGGTGQSGVTNTPRVTGPADPRSKPRAVSRSNSVEAKTSTNSVEAKCPREAIPRP